MIGEQQMDAAARRALEACAATADRLAEAGISQEGLAEFVPARRVLLVQRKATMRPIGGVWRLGSLLLAGDGRLFSVGRATRAAERGRPGYQSVSREERRDIAAAALRGGYAPGEAVNFDARPIDFGPSAFEALAAPTADTPVGFADGEVRVRWRAGAPLQGAPTLAHFLDERAELLIHPPL